MFGDGTFMLLSGGADLGTGLDTVSVKMASEVLKTPMDYISIISGDTDTTPFDVGAYASSGTYFSGSASLKAAQNMKKLIIKVAAEMLEEKEENIELEYPSKAKGKTGEVTYREIAAYTQSGTGCGQLIASGSFVTDDASFPYGAHFCQVAVNTRTGEIKIQKYYALQDCGTPINPELAIGQIYGGVLKSIGHSMYEEMVYDEDGKCLNSNFLDYKVPMINDLPEDFKVELIDVDDPFGPYGAKSVSEISTNGAAPVIANAIHDAVGIWIREWPFTPEKVLKELGKI
jgi:putative selenate reductase molybdopterin-binding subunit